jgi:hypothetical protein
MLSEPGQGFKIAMQTLDGGRIVGGTGLGHCVGVVDCAVKYALGAKLRQTISGYRSIQKQNPVHPCRGARRGAARPWRAAQMKNNGESIRGEAAMEQKLASGSGDHVHQSNSGFWVERGLRIRFFPQKANTETPESRRFTKERRNSTVIAVIRPQEYRILKIATM